MYNTEVYDKQIEHLMKIAELLNQTGFIVDTGIAESIGKMVAAQASNLLVEYSFMRTGYFQALSDSHKSHQRHYRYIREASDILSSEEPLSKEKIEEAKSILEALIY